MKNRDNQFIESKFTFRGKSYFRILDNSTGYLQTIPLESPEYDIYETGHYSVKKYFLIPILLNLVDLIYIKLLLSKFKITKNSRILDFGCGKGYLVYFLSKIGYNNVHGLETSINRATYARKITRAKITTEFYDGGTIMGYNFDCITLIHVLEHIRDPFEFLTKLISGALDKKGLLYIEVPNINSIASKISGDIWAHFTPHFHINHFSVKSLENYCKINNLNYSVLSTFSFYHSAMGMTSAFLSILGYKGSIYEDLKSKRIDIIISFIFLLPITFTLELLLSFFSKRGSVIKFVIFKKD